MHATIPLVRTTLSLLTAAALAFVSPTPATADIEIEATGAQVRAGSCIETDSSFSTFQEECGSPVLTSQTTVVGEPPDPPQPGTPTTSRGKAAGSTFSSGILRSTFRLDFEVIGEGEFSLSGFVRTNFEADARVFLTSLSDNGFTDLEFDGPTNDAQVPFNASGPLPAGHYRLDAVAEVNAFGEAEYELSLSFQTEQSDECDRAATHGCTVNGVPALPCAGTDGDDVIIGTDEDDVICGRSGDDEIRGMEGNDDLSGDAGSDKLFGGPGNDFLDGGADDDEMHGDAGDDELFDDEAGGVFIGGDGDDTMFGGHGPGSSIYCGGPGDDNISGGNAFDFILGGPGADDIQAFGGDDAIWGESSETAASAFGIENCHFADSGNAADNDDEIDAGGGIDFVSGGPGADFIEGGAGRDYVCGDHRELTGEPCVGLGEDPAFDGDVIHGGPGSDAGRRGGIDGGPGADDLFGGAGGDRMNGGDGDDRLFGERGKDKLTGGAGNDDLFGDPSRGPKRRDVLKGGTGNDDLFAKDGEPDSRHADVVKGEGGNDDASYDDVDQVTGVETRLP